MREICASGSVEGEGGNALAYPAGISCHQQRWSTTVEDDPEPRSPANRAARWRRMSGRRFRLVAEVSLALSADRLKAPPLCYR